MDLNQILIWTVCISCIALLMRSQQLFMSSQKGWIAICLGILLAIWILVQFTPERAGYISGLLWFGFIFFPLIASRQIQNSVVLEEYAKAAKQAAFWRWFHPTDGWWEQPKVLEALVLAQQGDLHNAISILNRYGDRHPNNRNLTWLATALAYKGNLQWQELSNWMQRDVPEKVLINSPNLMAYYIQALAETGELNRAIAEFQRLKTVLDPQRSQHIAMLLLAFAGETNIVAYIFRNMLERPKYFQLFWLGTAQMAAGHKEIGRELLIESSKIVTAESSRQNRSSSHRRIWLDWEKNIERRLQFGCVNADRVLTYESKSIIEQIKTQTLQESQYGGALKFNSKKAIATYGLIAINCLMFVWETVAGGNENEETLYRLGALVPSVVWDGEWWRLLSATFLHYGILHLSMNMMGLYFLGAYVESNFGIVRYLIAYFFSGIGSMFAVTVIAIFTKSPPQLLVGASGAIMGMVGALAAILLRGWLIDKAPLAGQRLRSVMFIIGLQIVFDLNTPQVSFLGHLSGLILGFAIACLFVFLLPKTRF